MKKILYVVVLSVCLFVLIATFLPREVHVERSIVIQRPAVTVFTLLNGYRSFRNWSPWVDRDPAAVYRTSGPEQGVGARISWSGEPRRVGTGWQEITESRPHTLIRNHLHFEQQGSAESYYRIEPVAGGTRVDWGFDTDLVQGQSWFAGVLARYFGLFIDSWVGADYEVGLSRLKALAELIPDADFSDLDVEIVQVEAQDILLVPYQRTGESPRNQASAYARITRFMTEHGIERAGQPMSIARFRDGRIDSLEAAIPVLPRDVPANDSVRFGRSPGGMAARVVHRGPYSQLGATYEKLAAWLAAHGRSEGGASWEQYMSNPSEVPDTERVTHIYLALRDAR